MFVNYYLILEIGQESTQEEIRIAFKQQAIKWHPDKNPGGDTTIKMQEINEAYLILKDADARKRYDLELLKFKSFQEQFTHKSKAPESPNKVNHNESKETSQSDFNSHSSYTISDEILKRWISNARNQAIKLAKQSLEDLKGMVNVGGKAAIKAGGSAFVIQILISILFMIIFAFTRSCQ